MTLQPRQTAHRGSVLASGLAIDTRLIPEPEARRRLLQLSDLGIDGFRVGPFLIVRLRDAVRVNCASTVGAPLVRYGRFLSSAPLAQDEQTFFEPVGEGVVLVDAGIASATRLDGKVREDISLWIDTSEFLVVDDVKPLGGVNTEPRAQLTPVTADVRGPLGVAPMNEEAAKLAESLLRPGPKSAAPGHAARAGAGLLGQIVGGLWQLIATVFSRTAASGEGGASNGRALAVTPNPAKAGESWLSRIRAQIQHFAARALLWSKLGHLIGRRQAEYLQRMLKMFDENDLENALRHAIPLSSQLEAALRPPALLTPSARSDLSIVPNRGAAATSLTLSGNLFEDLRQRYRRAFERLKALGEIEKAAFVLAELLNANEEAVSFLERNGRLRLAAEIAEARKLAPGLVVRQWFLAGERERAVAIARRTGAFADAIVRLESSHKDEALALRLLWADSLASSGAYAAAVDAVWPVELARHLALAWLERAIEVGGPTGARMLARKVKLVPEKFSELRDQSLKLLRDEGEDVVAVAQAFGAELINGQMTQETRVLAKTTARTLLRNGPDKDLDRLVTQLVDATGDGVFRADVKGSSQRRRVEPPGAVRVRASACFDPGAKRVHNEDVAIAALLDAPNTPQNNVHLDGDAAAKGIVLGVFDSDGSRQNNGHGRIASWMAAQTVTEALRAEFATSGAHVGAWARCLATSLEQAHHGIQQDAVGLRKGMVCCATVASISGNTLLLGQVGDTRGYVLRGDKLVQVTRDHTLRNEIIERSLAEGTPMTQQQLDNFVHKSVVTRALGIPESMKIDLSRVELQQNDVILLCTNGLWESVNETLLKTLLKNARPEAACKALLSLALEAGASDNVGIVVAQVDGKGLHSSQPSPLLYQPFVPPTVDIQESEAPVDLRSVTKPIEIRRAASDRGAIPIGDAALLPDGKMLVALGEMGAWLLARDGKVVTRFVEPASSIVISDFGDRALLLARRGETYRVSRIDLITKKVQPWCDARFDRFAADFDGSTWFVSRQDTLFAIDTMSPRWEQLWKVDEKGCFVSGIRRDANTASASFSRPGAGREVWTFELPSLTLRHRQQIERSAHEYLVEGISPNGAVVEWQTGTETLLRARMASHRAWMTWPLGDKPCMPGLPYVTASWIVALVIEPAAATLHLLDSAELHERARLTFEGEEYIGVRIQGDRLVVFDDHGRLLVLSLKTGTVMKEHRIA